MKTRDLTGQALDWAVAKCEGYTGLHKIAGRMPHEPQLGILPPRKEYGVMDLWELGYSTDWAQAGPIIEREGISTVFCSGDLGEPRSYWIATAEAQGWEWGYGPYHAQDDEKSIQIYKATTHNGPTPLIAAMRCYVASKLGDEVDVPEELA